MTVLLGAPDAASPGPVEVPGVEVPGVEVPGVEVPGAEVRAAEAPQAVDPLAWLSAPALVSVAAASGLLTGPALAVALACDVRVLTRSAGLRVPDRSVPVVAALARLAGPAVAIELCATGRAVGAEEAVRLGLAALSVPDGELAGVVADFAAAVLARPREDLVEAKALLQAQGWGRRPGGEQDALARLTAPDEETPWT